MKKYQDIPLSIAKGVKKLQQIELLKPADLGIQSEFEKFNKNAIIFSVKEEDTCWCSHFILDLGRPTDALPRPFSETDDDLIFVYGFLEINRLIEFVEYGDEDPSEEESFTIFLFLEKKFMETGYTENAEEDQKYDKLISYAVDIVRSHQLIPL